MRREILRFENVITEDPVMTDLDNFNMHVFSGEIMGLIGLNDVGIAKLTELICENQPIKFGRIYFAEKLVNSYSYSDRTANRVYVIGQASRLIPDLTVTDNVFVLRKGFGKFIVEPDVLARQLDILMKELGIYIDPYKYCSELSEYERCLAEMLKAIVQGVKLMIMEDIGNILSASDLEKMKKIMTQLIRKDYSVLYIGRHHEELFTFCTRVIFMKDGQAVKLFENSELTDEKAKQYTISFEDPAAGKLGEGRQASIHFENIHTDSVNELSFSMNSGECVVLFDNTSRIPFDFIDSFRDSGTGISGRIESAGFSCSMRDINRYIGHEIAVINENPTETMLFYDMSFIDNLCFLLDRKVNISNISSRLKKSIQKEYEPAIGKSIYTYDINSLGKESLYDLVYYRVHLLNPYIVFIIQPFANADMYLRRHITHLIRVLKRRGIAVVILAVSISDSLFSSDRLIMTNQKNTPVFPKNVPFDAK